MKTATLNVNAGYVEAFWTDEKLEIAARLWAKGEKADKIADLFDVSPDSFRRRVMQTNRHLFPKRLRQPVAVYANISENHDEIVRRHKAGQSMEDIISELNLSPTKTAEYYRQNQDIFDPKAHAKKLKKERRIRTQIRRSALRLCANSPCENQAVGRYCELCAEQVYAKPSAVRLTPTDRDLARYG